MTDCIIILKETRGPPLFCHSLPPVIDLVKGYPTDPLDETFVFPTPPF
jgi:hypothetical protein